MKTITITLNQEQERLLLDRIRRTTWKIPSNLHKYLTKEIKNPSEWTKQQIDYAKKLDKALDEEHIQMGYVINEIERQLQERS